MRLTTRGLLILVVVELCRAQGSAQGSTNAKGAPVMSSESIFNQIVQSMPADAQMRVDSASQSREAAHHDSGISKSGGRGTASVATKRVADEALSQLPRELQERVQRTMVELEQDKQRRAVEFKDRAVRRAAH
jgi:hypothetical protein